MGVQVWGSRISKGREEGGFGLRMYLLYANDWVPCRERDGIGIGLLKLLGCICVSKASGGAAALIEFMPDLMGTLDDTCMKKTYCNCKTIKSLPQIFGIGSWNHQQRDLANPQPHSLISSTVKLKQN